MSCTTLHRNFLSLGALSRSRGWEPVAKRAQPRRDQLHRGARQGPGLVREQEGRLPRRDDHRGRADLERRQPHRLLAVERGEKDGERVHSCLLKSSFPADKENFR